MDVKLEPTGFNLAMGTLGGFLCLYAATSFLIKERVFLTEAPLAVVVGIALERLHVIPKKVVGTPGSGKDPLDELSLSLSRMVLGIQLVMVGIQLPFQYPKIEFRSLFMLLVPVMIMMWLVTTGLTKLVIPEISMLAALVIASCATPTDPVLSNAIVKGSFADQHISPRLRNLISAESGANDGFAYPFLFLALRLIKSPTTNTALFSWFLNSVLYQVGGAIVFGAFVGVAANRILRWSTYHNTIDKESFVVFGIAVGIFSVGVGGLLDLDDLLAAFAAGNALTWDDWYRKETEDEELQNVTDLLLNTSFFMYVGATIPWESFTSKEIGLNPARLVLLSVLVLLLRRLPALILAYRYIPRVKTLSEATLMGYFGPIGAGAIFYASLVLDQIKEEGQSGDDGERIREIIKPIIYALVIASLLGHSVAIPILKLIFERFDIGNIKLVGNENMRLAQEDDSDAGSDTEEDPTASSGAPQAPDDLDAAEAGQQPPEVVQMESAPNTRPGSFRSQQHQPSYPLYLYPDGKGSYYLDGRWNPEASWRISSSHGPSTGYRFGQQGPHGTGGRAPGANPYRRAQVPSANTLPNEWNERVRYLDEETGTAGLQASSTRTRVGSSQQHPSAHRNREETLGDIPESSPPTQKQAVPPPHQPRRSNSTAPLERSSQNQQHGQSLE